MYLSTYVGIGISCSSKLTKAIINFIQLGGMHFLQRLIHAGTICTYIVIALHRAIALEPMGQWGQ